MTPLQQRAVDIRARLHCPPNAVPDTGITMRNGAPVLRVVRPFQPSRWKTPTLTQVWEVTPYPLPAFLPPAVPRQPDTPSPPGYLKPKATAILVINEICSAWGIEHYRILGPQRIAEIVKPRSAAMAIIRRITSMSFPQIGKFFGGRDHSTILHANRKMAHHIAALNQELTDWSTPAEWVRALKARLEA